MELKIIVLSEIIRIRLRKANVSCFCSYVCVMKTELTMWGALKSKENRKERIRESWG